jgi:ribosomal protein L10
MESDDGHAISYKALRRGTPVWAVDGTEVGKVRKVQDNTRENIFDGIVVESRDGMRFVDAPEVKRVAELAVTLTITAEEFSELTAPQSLLKQRWDQAPLVRRTRRKGRDLRRKWDNR